MHLRLRFRLFLGFRFVGLQSVLPSPGIGNLVRADVRGLDRDARPRAVLFRPGVRGVRGLARQRRAFRDVRIFLRRRRALEIRNPVNRFLPSELRVELRLVFAGLFREFPDVHLFRETRYRNRLEYRLGLFPNVERNFVDAGRFRYRLRRFGQFDRMPVYLRVGLRLERFGMPRLGSWFLLNGEQDVRFRGVLVRVRYVLLGRNPFRVPGVPRGGDFRDVDVFRTERRGGFPGLYRDALGRGELRRRQPDRERARLFRSRVQPWGDHESDRFHGNR